MNLKINAKNTFLICFLIFFSNSISGETIDTTYIYDNLNRLKTVTYSDGTIITYTYDDAGNRTGLEVTAGNRIIQVTSPNGGEEWPIGSSQSISWNSANVTGNVDILLSRNNGTTWETLFANTVNDGNEPWNVAGETSDQCLIRVESADFGNVYDVSDGTFSITPKPPDFITVISPNGGENWETGSIHNITWTSNVTGNVDIFLSRDNGATWETLLANTANDGNEPWTVTGETSDRCFIRVVSVDFGSVFDASDGAFGIIPLLQNSLIINDPPVQGEIDPAGDTDWFYFTVTTPGRYTIQTYLGTLVDTYIYLYGPNDPSIYITENDDGGQGWASKITQQLNPGTYYVKVRAYSIDQFGTYAIRVFQSYDSINGRVIDNYGNGIQNVQVYIYSTDYEYITDTVTDSNGNYSVTDLETGEYKIYFDTYNTGNYVSEWYNDKQSFDDGDIVQITTGQTTTLTDAVLLEGAIIDGRVTDNQGNGIADVYVFAFDLNYEYIKDGYTDSNGYYTIQAIPGGDYKFYFDAYNAGNYINEWYNDKTSFSEADNVSVATGQTTTLADAVLTEGGSISGRITDAQGNGIANVYAYVFDLNYEYIKDGYTDSNGYYTIQAVPAGDYKLFFDAYYAGNFFSEWYNDKAQFSEADNVSVTSGQATILADAVLSEGGSISGRVTDNQDSGIENVQVRLYDQDYNWIYVGSTDSSGNYSISKVSQGSYKVYFSPNGLYSPRWYNDQDSFASASLVNVIAGQDTTGIDEQLNAITPIEIIINDPPVQAEINPSGEHDGFFFTITTQGRYTIQTYLGTLGDSYIYLYGPDDSSLYIAEDDDGGQGLASKITHTLNPGTYYVKVRAYSIDQSGTYAIRVFQSYDSITGQVIDNDGNGIPDVWIFIYDLNYEEITYTATDSNGNYKIIDLETGEYKIYFDASAAGNYTSEWYDNKASFDSADTVAITQGENTYINVTLSNVIVPSIQITSPNGGEILTAGSAYEITWTSTEIGDSVIIQYYNGISWKIIASSTANTGSYLWTVPDTPSDNCLVRVSGGYADDAPADMSDAAFSIVSAPGPTLRMISPNGGERIKVGSTYQITWAGNGAVGDVRLEYSIDNGISWIIIVPSTNNNGSYQWTVPDTPSESCLVRVGESDKDIGISDMSDGGFSIVSAPFITVNSPNGGETWEVGATHQLTWTGTGIDGNVKIEYSTTNGTSWTTIAASAGNTGSLNWTVPDTPAENCLIRIGDIDGEPIDVSNAAFSIIPAPFLTVTSPNGGENWNAGSTHNITWTASGTVGKLNIEYSIDNGGSWIIIASTVDNNGSYSWLVPDNPSENCRVRISENNSDRNLADLSNATFSIAPAPVVSVTSPNGGERLEANTTHQITWNSSGTIGEIKIEYSTNNGGSWAAIVNSTANDGSHSWAVPDSPSKSCLIRISETDGEPADISDAVFSIVSPSTATITVTSPNGGESLTAGSTHEITWTGTGMEANDQVMIEYSPDNGGCWLNIVPSTANTGSYNWTVPDNPAENCLIRVAGSDADEGPADISDEPFAIVPPSSPTITVTSPNGGETLTSNSTHDITWTCSGMEQVENIIIECSTDNGANWTAIAFSTSDIGSFSWSVPDNPADNCLIRIRLSDSDEGLSDTSDEVFSIISAPVIDVTSPNGGEQWKIGSLYNITWSSAGITGDIVIDLYRGTSFDLNIGSVSVETGSFAWNIPGNFAIGNDYKIFLHKDSTEDYSDAEFSIVDKEPNQPDFNNDGHVDILWRNYASGINEVWLMNGSVRTETSSLPAMPDLNWRLVGTGDFNRDGKVDILWRNYTNGQNLVWYMDGIVQSGFEYLLNQPDINWQIGGTGDFNGDGSIDILWRNPLEGRNQVWYMEGVNVKGYQALPSFEGIHWRIAGTGDFNGDNHVDILWRNYATGSNEVWYMNGASRINTAAVLEMSDLNWRLVGIGDFNRDGEVDILWRNYSDGKNMIWYMDGITRTGYEYIETRSDLNWQVTGNGDYRE